jgi:hypothetical protein
MDNGRQSVMMDGVTRTQESCVGNWDLLTMQEVSSIKYITGYD